MQAHGGMVVGPYHWPSVAALKSDIMTWNPLGFGVSAFTDAVSILAHAIEEDMTDELHLAKYTYLKKIGVNDTMECGYIILFERHYPLAYVGKRDSIKPSTKIVLFESKDVWSRAAGDEGLKEEM